MAVLLGRQTCAQRAWVQLPLVHISVTGRRRKGINIFILQGQLVAPIRVKFGMAKRHIGPLIWL